MLHIQLHFFRCTPVTAAGAIRRIRVKKPLLLKTMTNMFLTLKPLSKVQSKTPRSQRKVIPLYVDDGGSEETPVEKEKSAAEEEFVDEEV